VKIYFHISGRLGNQLFQWAFLHELISNGFEVQLFIDKYHNNIDTPQDLSKLLIECRHLPKIQTRNDLGFLLKCYEKLLSGGKLSQNIAKKLPVLIEEFPRVQNKKLSFVIIDGFFIDKQWPIKHKDELTREIHKMQNFPEFQTNTSNSGIKIGSTTLHVRRGDYHNYRKTFGLLSSSYYLKLIEPREEAVVLTDSPKEAKGIFGNRKNLIFTDPSIIDPWQALYVMSKSKRLLMGNSTLSWWGGFLAFYTNNADVVMPIPFYFQPGKFDSQLAVDGFKFEESIFE